MSAMSSFEALLERWRTADVTASQQEHRVSHVLDRYVEGAGPPPSASDIEQLRTLRAEAVRTLCDLLAFLDEERRRLPPL